MPHREYLPDELLSYHPEDIYKQIPVRQKNLPFAAPVLLQADCLLPTEWLMLVSPLLCWAGKSVLRYFPPLKPQAAMLWGSPLPANLLLYLYL